MKSTKTSMRILASTILFAGALAAGSASAERAYTAIEQRLSAEQMRATGLDQLSAEQLSRLNQLLRDEQASVAPERGDGGRGRNNDARTAVTSTLKGEFRGWQNGTVFELENGQRWRVVDGEFQASRRLANPKVEITPGVFGSWYMLIEGTSVKAKVKRL